MCVAVLVSGAHCRGTEPHSPQVNAGKLDLSAHSLESGRVKLDGQWEFYFGEFVDAQAEKEPESRRFSPLPGYWNEDPTLPGTGFATYRMSIRMHPSDLETPLALYVPHAFTSYRLYVNGRIASENGAPGRTAVTSTGYFLPKTASFRTSGAVVDILIHVANHSSQKGGFRQSIELGREGEVLRHKQILVAQDLFVSGGILVIALYHFRLFLLRRSESYALFFSLAALMLVLYKLTTGEYFLVLLFPSMPWKWTLKVFFLSLYLAVPFFLAFVERIYPAEGRGPAVRILQTAFAVLIGVILVRADWMEESLVFAEALIFLGCVYSIVVFVRAAQHKREGAGGFIGGFIFLFGTAINDTLFERDVIRTEIAAPLGIFVLLLSHSSILLQRFNRLLETVELQRTELTRTVALKQQLFRARIKSKRLELEMLKKAIQPHFLVNSLAAIRAWLLESPAAAGQLLDDFSAEMRAIQTIASRKSIPIHEELSLCAYHLRVMGARREKSYRFFVRGMDGGENVPPMIFHTMMENAFTHLDTENGSLHFFLIRSVLPGGVRFLFVVKNTSGRLPARKKGSGLGLRYVRARLEESYPGRWTAVSRPAKAGYCVEIQIEERGHANLDRRG